MYKHVIKPVADRAFALFLLVVLSPLWFMLSILSLALNGEPLLYRQVRIGLGGVPFTILKIRTISVKVGETRRSEKNGISNWSKFLRVTGLDEWPQLFNIIKGEMSFVGPRPLLPEYMPLYSPKELERHLVKPGLTGLVQVSGRNTLSWSDRFALDIKYVKTQNLGLDLWILFRTPVVMLKRRGASLSKPFKGSF